MLDQVSPRRFQRTWVGWGQRERPTIGSVGQAGTTLLLVQLGQQQCILEGKLVVPLIEQSLEETGCLGHTLGTGEQANHPPSKGDTVSRQMADEIGVVEDSLQRRPDVIGPRPTFGRRYRLEQPVGLGRSPSRPARRVEVENHGGVRRSW